MLFIIYFAQFFFPAINYKTITEESEFLLCFFSICDVTLTSCPSFGNNIFYSVLIWHWLYLYCCWSTTVCFSQQENTFNVNVIRWRIFTHSSGFWWKHLFFKFGHFCWRLVPELVGNIHHHVHAFIHQTMKGGERLWHALKTHTHRQTDVTLLSHRRQTFQNLVPWSVSSSCKSETLPNCSAAAPPAPQDGFYLNAAARVWPAEHVWPSVSKLTASIFI